MTGIDVSSFQKTVDWEKVKASGVSFAMIRLGFRGYAAGTLTPDRFYEENIRKSREAGLPRGVYFFSTAIDASEAVEEADWVSRLLEGQSPELPVAFDSEYITSDKAYRTAGITKKARSDAAISFLRRIRENGYEPMMYASENGFRNNWDTPRILSSTGCRVWLARYYQNNGIPNKVPPDAQAWDLWQYTSAGRVDGVTGPCDLNTVRVPFWESAGAEPSEPLLYTVVKGDVPERVARRFGVTPAALIAANKEKYPSVTLDFIRAGWELIIPAEKDARQVRVTSPIGLNVREGPRVSAKKRGALSYGAEVTVLSSAGGWGKISYQGSPGYISLQYTKTV